MQQQTKKFSKIYSRKRLNINLLRNKTSSKKNKNKIKKIIPIIWVSVIAIITCYSVWSGVNPIFEKLCEEKAKSVATKITNEETTNVINKYNYDTFFTIEKDENGKIQMITANILKINQVISDIALNIQEALDKNEKNKIYISLGALTGIKYLSGFGAKIGMNIASSGNVEINVRSQFESQGVNQTIHRVYLDIKTNVSILTSFEIIEKNIENQVLILENVIIGEIPYTYLDQLGTFPSQLGTFPFWLARKETSLTG